MPPGAPTSPPLVVHLPLKPGGPELGPASSAWGQAGVEAVSTRSCGPSLCSSSSYPGAGREPPHRMLKVGCREAWGGRPWAEVHFPTVDELSLPSFIPSPATCHPQPMIRWTAGPTCPRDKVPENGQAE